MATKKAFNALSLARLWEADASALESRVRRADPEDTPATRRVLTARAAELRRCSADLKREAGRGG